MLKLLLLLLLSSVAQSRNFRQDRAHICIVTCDFWGLPAAGGTATAYHLLAASLADAGPRVWPVTFLGATHQTSLCQDIQQNFSSGSINFECLKPEHFLPEVVNNFPYEALGIAVVRWLQRSGQKCDVIHTHEWGGGMQQLAALVSMRRKPNLRLVVEPHGGHYWSSQGTRQRPTDLFTLRIDDHERLTMHLADDVKSPSAYMLAHLRQRGWRLPPAASVIPNIVPQAATSAEKRQLKPVWQLAFFGRLEERKGLKLFCDAMEMIDISTLPRLEIIFIGGEAQVDMIPSVKYLNTRTAGWPMPVKIYGGLPRAAALAILRAEGVMVAFTSLVENLPFALAEACIEEIPFVTFNVGGVAELFDADVHADVIVETVSALALFDRLEVVLRQGTLQTSVLHPAIKNSADLWHLFHVNQDLSERHRQLKRVATASADAQSVEVVKLAADCSSKTLKQDVCGHHADNSVLLLVPPEYSMPSASDMGIIEYVASQLPRLSKTRMVGALVFGAMLPNGLVSYPTSPTWMIYHGSEPLCVESSPLLLLTKLFCTNFLAEAGDFNDFQTWVLIHHLRMAGLVTTSFPEPVFTMNNFSRADTGCLADRIPAFRKLEGDLASNQMGVAEQVLISQHLAPIPHPAASFRSNFDKFQGQHGWQYIAIDEYGKQCWLNSAFGYMRTQLS